MFVLLFWTTLVLAGKPPQIVVISLVFQIFATLRQSLAKSALTGKPLQMLFVVTVVISLVYQIFAALETKTFLSLVFS